MEDILSSLRLMPRIGAPALPSTQQPQPKQHDADFVVNLSKILGLPGNDGAEKPADSSTAPAAKEDKGLNLDGLIKTITGLFAR